MTLKSLATKISNKSKRQESGDLEDHLLDSLESEESVNVNASCSLRGGRGGTKKATVEEVDLSRIRPFDTTGKKNQSGGRKNSPRTEVPPTSPNPIRKSPRIRTPSRKSTDS